MFCHSYMLNICFYFFNATYYIYVEREREELEYLFNVFGKKKFIVSNSTTKNSLFYFYYNKYLHNSIQ